MQGGPAPYYSQNPEPLWDYADRGMGGRLAPPMSAGGHNKEGG